MSTVCFNLRLVILLLLYRQHEQLFHILKHSISFHTPLYYATVSHLPVSLFILTLLYVIA